jgi:hypothetical protein
MVFAKLYFFLLQFDYGLLVIGALSVPAAPSSFNLPAAFAPDDGPLCRRQPAHLPFRATSAVELNLPS